MKPLPLFSILRRIFHILYWNIFFPSSLEIRLEPVFQKREGTKTANIRIRIRNDKGYTHRNDKFATNSDSRMFMQIGRFMADWMRLVVIFRIFRLADQYFVVDHIISHSMLQTGRGEFQSTFFRVKQNLSRRRIACVTNCWSEPINQALIPPPNQSISRLITIRIQQDGRNITSWKLETGTWFNLISISTLN